MHLLSPLSGPRPALILLAATVFWTGCQSGSAPSEDASVVPETSRLEVVDSLSAAAAGQTLYVPVYSHIFHQDGTRELDLTTTLSIRNTDPAGEITITTVDYYDSAGRLVRRYTERPFRLGPLASEAFVIEERDRTGGVGANFLVDWQSATDVSSPLIEAVMVSTAQSQGISLMSRGEVIDTLDAETVEDAQSP